VRLLARIGLFTLAAAFSITFFFGMARFTHGLGVAPARYLISNGLLFFAGALGVTGCLIKSRRLAEQHKAELQVLQFTGNRLEAGVSKVFAVTVYLIVLVALWVTYLVLRWPPSDQRALALPAAFLLFALFMLSALHSLIRSGKPALVLDTFALDHAWYGPIRWDQIHGIHLRTFKRRRSTHYLLALLVDKPGRYLAQSPWFRRVFTSARRRDAACALIELPLNSLTRSPVLIHKAAVALRSRVSPPPLSFWVPWLSAEAIGVQREIDAAYRRLDEIGQLIEQDNPDPDQIERGAREVAADIKRLHAVFDEAYCRSASATTKRDVVIVVAILVALTLLFLWPFVVRVF
jgi:hypothetical protein